MHIGTVTVRLDDTLATSCQWLCHLSWTLKKNLISILSHALHLSWKMSSIQLPVTRTYSQSSTTNDDSLSDTHVATFMDKTPERAAARATYLKIFVGGTLVTIIIIFTVFVIFWSALAKTPARNLSGWIVVRLINLKEKRVLNIGGNYKNF